MRPWYSLWKISVAFGRRGEDAVGDFLVRHQHVLGDLLRIVVARRTVVQLETEARIRRRDAQLVAGEARLDVARVGAALGPLGLVDVLGRQRAGVFDRRLAVGTRAACAAVGVSCSAVVGAGHEQRAQQANTG